MITHVQGSVMTGSVPRSLPLSFEVLREGTVVPTLEEMTFPVYRKFLALRPTPRHPELGDRRVVQPVGLVAWQGEHPVGLLLAERPVEAPDRAELLSVYVEVDRRNAGVATGLVDRLEQHLRAAGVKTVSAVYMTGKPGIAAMERVFEKCRWTPPEARTISVWFTPEEAMRMPWFGRIVVEPPDFENLCLGRRDAGREGGAHALARGCAVDPARARAVAPRLLRLRPGVEHRPAPPRHHRRLDHQPRSAAGERALHVSVHEAGSQPARTHAHALHGVDSAARTRRVRGLFVRGAYLL